MKLNKVIAFSLAVAALSGCASVSRDPLAPRTMNGSWCSLGTSISWYNDNVANAKGRFTRGYQSRVMDVLKFSGFANPAVNGGTIGVQSSVKIPKADYYTIEHGINDWGRSTPVGTIDDYREPGGKDNFFANYRRVVDKIRAANPKAKIIVCTPRKGYGFNGYLPKSSAEPKKGIYLRQYVDAVRAIAAEEKFTLADFYSTCGEDGELKSLSIDVALHPNDDGYERMAKELLKAFSRVD